MPNRARARRAAAALVLAALLASCDRGPEGSGRSPSTPAFTPPAASSGDLSSPPPPPVSPPPTLGPPGPGCEGGWRTPPEGDRLRAFPLRVIRRATGVEGPLVVVDLRYFVGPESPPSEKGYLLEVERWYVKLWARRDPSFRGRFLVERRRFGAGLVAVAPYDSAGFRSPDWVGFQFDPDAPPQRYPGLPGTWRGVAYDFVRGGAGLRIPGLPEEVRGCLEGT